MVWPPEMEAVFVSGIKRERLPGGLSRLYLYEDRPHNPHLNETLEESQRVLMVIMMVVVPDAMLDAPESAELVRMKDVAPTDELLN